MQPYYALNCIPAMLDEADADGMLTFAFPNRDIDTPSLVTRKAYIARITEVMQATFMAIGLVRLKGRWIDNFDASCYLEGERWICRISLVKAFCMPGVALHDELRELKTFFKLCQRYMLSVPAGTQGIVKFLNERDSRDKVYGRVLFTSTETPSVAAVEAASKATAELEELLAVTPLLQEWLRGVALMLGKIGRYSWWNMSERSLFPEAQQPYYQYLAAEYERKHNITTP